VKALGTLSHETKSGNLVIRGNEVPTPQAPSIYSYAHTKKMRVGKIQDVIGPVSRPYVILKPHGKLSKKEISSLSGETIYESRSNNAKTRRNYTRKKSRVH
jgi:rRNA processing protein Gar1